METNYCISTINPGFTSHINLSFITNFISGMEAQCRYISIPVQASYFRELELYRTGRHEEMLQIFDSLKQQHK